MGDVLTLIEKAQSAYTEEEAKALEKKFREQSFTLSDYLIQMDKMKSMGSLTQMVSMIPGLASKLGGQDLNVDEGRLARTKAIIQSMTEEERNHPDIIKASRKKRIAAGSGTELQDVNSLLKQFEASREMMKRMRNGRRGGFPF